MQRWMRLTCAASLGWSVACGAPLSEQRAPERPNVILITIDTLRADRVGAYGHAAARTPALDALASSGLRFANAVTHSPLTLPAHVSIMTGRFPSSHGVRDNGTYVLAPEAITVAERLHDAGYRTGAFVASFILDSGFGLDQGFTIYDDALASGGPLLDYDASRAAPAVAASAVEWMKQVRSEPFFAWVHLFDPHSPYQPQPPFDALADPYDGDVAAADAGVAQIVAAVRELGLADRTAVIVTADHGEGLGDHGEREHGLLLYDSVLRVPLIVNGPGIGPGLVDRQALHVDLMPTILALARVAPADGLPGHDLLAFVKAPLTGGEAVSYAESWYGRLQFGWSELRSIRVDGWKYIDGPRPELYDLRRDPGEKIDRASERPDLAARLRSELRRIADSGDPSLARVEKPDPETVSKLRSLGYLSGGGAPADDRRGTARANPKDMLPVLETYVLSLNQGIALLRENRASAAVDGFRDLARQHPSSVEATHYLGYALAAAGRHAEALDAYDRAVALNPAYALAHFNAARSLSALGRHDTAKARLERGFATEPRSFYGFMIRGVTAWAAGDNAGAVEAFEHAASLNPAEPRAAANLAEACMRTGDYARARTQYERLIAMHYQPAAAYFNLGVIEERAGDAASARQAYRRALELEPTLVPAREALAKLR